MKIVISNPFAAHDTTVPGQSPIISDQDLLFNTLREASVRASQQQRAVLASYTQPIERYDTIQAFNGARQAGLGECFFWEQPAEQNTLIGIGATTAIETMGSTCFIDSASAWRSLLNHAVITSTPSTLPTPGSGPVLFGGFAFDPLSPRTQLWADFPAGLLILPHFLLSYTANQVTLTINHLIQPFENIERCVWEIESGVRQLHAAIEQTRTIPTEETSNKFSIHEQRSASEWMATVANTVDNIQHGAFEKVVLARDIQVKLDDPSAVFDISLTLQRLRENYPAAYVFAIQRGERFFMGATPERLGQAEDGQIHTTALAGAAQRGETTAEDAQLGADLLQSEKTNNNHAIVLAILRAPPNNHRPTPPAPPGPPFLQLKNFPLLMTPFPSQ